MTTLSIPEKLIKEKDLVLIPRKEYEAFLKLRKNIDGEIIVKRSKSFRIPKRHERFYNELDKELTLRLREYYRGGKSHGPFESAEETIKFLNSRRSSIKK